MQGRPGPGAAGAAAAAARPARGGGFFAALSSLKRKYPKTTSGDYHKVR